MHSTARRSTFATFAIAMLLVVAPLLGAADATTAVSATSSVPSAAPILADGIYVADAAGNPIAPFRLKVFNPTLVADNNANTFFYLNVSYPKSGTPDQNHFAVVLDGHPFPATASGSINVGSDREIAFTFALEIPATACPAATRILGCAPVFRHHPGYRLDATFTPSKAAFVPGGKMWVHLTLSNLDDKPFTFMRSTPLDADCAFMDLQGPAAVAGIHSVTDSSGETETIAPGGHIEADVDISTWLTLTVPGTYHLRGMLHFTCYADEAHAEVGSWDDILARDFTVVVNAP